MRSLSKKDYVKVRMDISTSLLLRCVIFFIALLFCIVILTVSNMGLEASSKFIYQLYMFFNCSLVILVISSLYSVIGLLRLLFLKHGKYSVQRTNKILRFSNVSKDSLRAISPINIVYVKILFRKVFIKVEV